MSFTVVGPNHYQASAGDKISFSVEADNVPFSVAIGPHSTAAVWTVDKQHSEASPEQIQSFTMPTSNDHFTVTYGFGPTPPDGAHYTVTVTGNGGQDGPSEVGPGAFSTVSLQYFFDVAP
jgi:hypothetical protein